MSYSDYEDVGMILAFYDFQADMCKQYDGECEECPIKDECSNADTNDEW